MKKRLEAESRASGENGGGRERAGRTRPPLERMKQIYGLLQAGAYPNCFTLAERLEVSRATIKRDLEFMRERMNWPMEYDSQRHGYCFTQPVDEFPGVPVSEAELFALLVAHKAIEQYHGTPFQRPLQMAFHKLTGQLDGQARYTLEHSAEVLSFRPFAPEDADLRVFEAVTRALGERRALRFNYKKPGTKAAEPRHVHPYHLACIHNGWYLITQDVARRGLRTFALARVSAPVLTDERFIRPKDFNPDKHLHGSFGAMSGEADYEVVIEFDAWAADMLAGRQWHASQQVTTLPGGACHFRLRLSRLEEVERWILSWGAHATVLKPQALAERLRQTAAELANRYPASGPGSVSG